MRVHPIVATLVLLTAYPPTRLPAQVNLGVHHTGLSIGNSKEWTGVRINFRDDRVERVRGLPVALGTPAKDGCGARLVEGISVGVSPAAERLKGINLGIGAVVAER